MKSIPFDKEINDGNMIIRLNESEYLDTFIDNPVEILYKNIPLWYNVSKKVYSKIDNVETIELYQQMSEWCAQNIDGAVDIQLPWIIFESHTDAVQFKLRWA